MRKANFLTLKLASLSSTEGIPIVRRGVGVEERRQSSLAKMAAETEEDLILKGFFAEVSEVERDNEVIRFESIGNCLFSLFILIQELSICFVFQLFYA